MSFFSSSIHSKLKSQLNNDNSITLISKLRLNNDDCRSVIVITSEEHFFTQFNELRQ